MTKTILARLLGDRRGVAAIEFGLVAPVLFSMLLGGLEFGRMFYVRQGLEGVVETAARYYVLNPTAASSAVTAYMRTQPMLGGSISLVSFGYSDTPSCNGNAKVTCTMVTGTYAFSFATSYLGFGARTLTASAQAVRQVSP
jgi:Flp pilus assembly protein TadG